MRTAYLRTSLQQANTKPHILICIGFGLMLIMNATSAETTGISAMGLALAKPFASLMRHSASSENPLSARDARHYVLAFSAVSDGHWDDAEVEANRAADPLLRGEVLAARYLSPAYRPDYSELSAWLVRYSDLPDAAAIRHRAEALRPAGMSLPRAPAVVANDDAPAGQPVVRLPGTAMVSRIRLTGHYAGPDLKAVNHLVASISSHLRDDAAVTARRVVDTNPAVALLEEQDLATIQAHIAASLLYDGDTGAALRLAEESLSADDSDEARWTAGLASYRLERYEAARDNFAAIGKSAASEPWTNSAASFWAARACLKLHDKDDADHWLDQAATYRGTFYGMLAERTRGEAVLTAASAQVADMAGIVAIPAGRRGMALLQIGQADRAEAELRLIDVSSNPLLRNSLRLYAWRMNLPNLAQRIGAGLTGGGATHGGYPTPSLQLRGGFTTDPALVYAITRQESRFDARAESDAGAIGLMQIMPQTAAAISDSQQGASGQSQQRQAWKQKLRDPVTNVELGQRYIQMLLSSSRVSGNLLMMAAAYNSGPGNLTRWRGDGDETDPLMFLETLPAAETRGFVEQVMANYWIYQLQMKSEPSSLADLAAGKWPLYKPVAPQPILMADRG